MSTPNSKLSRKEFDSLCKEYHVEIKKLSHHRLSNVIEKYAYLANDQVLPKSSPHQEGFIECQKRKKDLLSKLNSCIELQSPTDEVFDGSFNHSSTFNPDCIADKCKACQDEISFPLVEDVDENECIDIDQIDKLNDLIDEKSKMKSKIKSLQICCPKRIPKNSKCYNKTNQFHAHVKKTQKNISFCAAEKKNNIFVNIPSTSNYVLDVEMHSKNDCKSRLRKRKLEASSSEEEGHKKLCIKSFDNQNMNGLSVFNSNKHKENVNKKININLSIQKDKKAKNIKKLNPNLTVDCAAKNLDQKPFDKKYRKSNHVKNLKNDDGENVELQITENRKLRKDHKNIRYLPNNDIFYQCRVDCNDVTSSMKYLVLLDDLSIHIVSDLDLVNGNILFHKELYVSKDKKYSVCSNSKYESDDDNLSQNQVLATKHLYLEQLFNLNKNEKWSQSSVGIKRLSSIKEFAEESFQNELNVHHLAQPESPVSIKENSLAKVLTLRSKIINIPCAVVQSNKVVGSNQSKENMKDSLGNKIDSNTNEDDEPCISRPDTSNEKLKLRETKSPPYISVSKLAGKYLSVHEKSSILSHNSQNTLDPTWTHNDEETESRQNKNVLFDLNITKQPSDCSKATHEKSLELKNQNRTSKSNTNIVKANIPNLIKLDLLSQEPPDTSQSAHKSVHMKGQGKILDSITMADAKTNSAKINQATSHTNMPPKFMSNSVLSLKSLSKGSYCKVESFNVNASRISSLKEKRREIFDNFSQISSSHNHLDKLQKNDFAAHKILRSIKSEWLNVSSKVLHSNLPNIDQNDGTHTEGNKTQGAIFKAPRKKYTNLYKHINVETKQHSSFASFCQDVAPFPSTGRVKENVSRYLSSIPSCKIINTTDHANDKKAPGSNLQKCLSSSTDYNFLIVDDDVPVQVSSVISNSSLISFKKMMCSYSKTLPANEPSDIKRSVGSPLKKENLSEFNRNTFATTIHDRSSFRDPAGGSNSYMKPARYAPLVPCKELRKLIFRNK